MSAAGQTGVSGLGQTGVGGLSAAGQSTPGSTLRPPGGLAAAGGEAAAGARAAGAATSRPPPLLLVSVLMFDFCLFVRADVFWARCWLHRGAPVQFIKGDRCTWSHILDRTILYDIKRTVILISEHDR